jgi:hypothetical protein
MVYPGAGHPDGSGPAPWYQLRGGWAYPVEGHPCGPSSQPALVVDAGLVYPAVDDHTECGTPPWFAVGLHPE